MKQQEKTERHHCLPLALGGTNERENIIVLKKTTHKLVHQVLNIPYKHIRSYRTKLNWKVLLDEEVLEAERKMQLAYFENSEWLPQEEFKKHYINILLQAWRIPKELITYSEGKKEIMSSIGEMIDVREEIIYSLNLILWEYDLVELSAQENPLYGKMCIKNDILKKVK